MKALVVYESFWGNTAAIAEAIAQGIGGDTRALHTDEASPEMLADVNLLVAGAPLMGFSLPREQTREMLTGDKKAPRPADVTHPSMRAWLDTLARADASHDGAKRYATFETRFRWSPGSAAGKIAKALEQSGFRRAAAPGRFLIKGSYGPMRDGELERARAWGASLSKAIS